MPNDEKKNDNFRSMAERYKEGKWARELAKDREKFHAGMTSEENAREKEKRKKGLTAQRERFRIKSTPEALEAERERFRVKPKMEQYGVHHDDKKEEAQQGIEESRGEESAFNQYEEEKKLAKNQNKDRKEKEEKEREEAAEGILSEKNPYKKMQRILDFIRLFSGAGSLCGDMFVSVPTFFLLHLEFLVPCFLPNYKIARWKKILVFAIDIYIFIMFSLLIIIITVILDKTGGTAIGAAWWGVKNYFLNVWDGITSYF